MKILYKYCVHSTFFFNSSPNFENHYFFFLPFSAMALPQIFFLPYFGNGIATIDFPLGASHFEHFTHTRSASLGNRNFGNMIIEIQNFLSRSLPLFLFLSHTFVEFRQHRYRNSLSFFNYVNKLKQYL